MSDATAPRLGIVTQVSPLMVRLNGDTVSLSAFPLDDFSTATVNVTECLVVTVERRQFASRVAPGPVALQYTYDNIPATTLTGSFATIKTTASLAVGVWSIAVNTIVNAGSSNAQCDIKLVPGTATVTFAGTMEEVVTNIYPNPMEISLNALAIVTVAGTVLIQAYDPGAHSSTIGGTTHGYTAVKVA